MVEPNNKTPVGEAQSRGHQIVESLLSKPAKKPNFAAVAESAAMPDSILRRAEAFLPEFIRSTDKILSCPEARMASQMHVKIAPSGSDQASAAVTMTEGSAAKSASVINMDIGIGLYDVQDDGSRLDNGLSTGGQFGRGPKQPSLNNVEDNDVALTSSASQLPPGLGYHQISTEPILRVLNNHKHRKERGMTDIGANADALARAEAKLMSMEHDGGDDSQEEEAKDDSESSSSESSSGDEDRFMVFESSGEDEDNDGDEEQMVDAQSITTKSSCCHSIGVLKAQRVEGGAQAATSLSNLSGSESLLANGEANKRKYMKVKKPKGPLIQEISSTEFATNSMEEVKDEHQLATQAIGVKRKFRERP